MAMLMKHSGTRTSAAGAVFARPLLKWSEEQAGPKGASVKAQKQPLLALTHCKDIRAVAARQPWLLAAPFLAPPAQQQALSDAGAEGQAEDEEQGKVCSRDLLPGIK